MQYCILVFYVHFMFIYTYGTAATETGTEGVKPLFNTLIF